DEDREVDEDRSKDGVAHHRPVGWGGCVTRPIDDTPARRMRAMSSTIDPYGTVRSALRYTGRRDAPSRASTSSSWSEATTRLPTAIVRSARTLTISPSRTSSPRVATFGRSI